jgi:hypothetical protein
VATAVDYSSLDDTALAQQLHKLALQLHAAMGAKDVARVKQLWAEFQSAAAEYADRDQLSGLDAFLNNVSDGVQAFLKGVGDYAQSTIRSIVWPVAIVALLLAAAYFYVRRSAS